MAVGGDRCRHGCGGSGAAAAAAAGWRRGERLYSGAFFIAGSSRGAGLVHRVRLPVCAACTAHGTRRTQDADDAHSITVARFPSSGAGIGRRPVGSARHDARHVDRYPLPSRRRRIRRRPRPRWSRARRRPACGRSCCRRSTSPIWRPVRELAHRFGLAYALGIHPLCVDRADDGDLARARRRTGAPPRRPAAGRGRRDRHRPFHAGLSRERQEFFYAEQLTLARRHQLPVIAACAALGRYAAQAPAPQRRLCGGIAHAFNGSAQQAAAFVELGFKLGFGGAMTFDRALQIRRLARSLPAEAIVLETDSPDIPPHWLYRTAAEREADGDPRAGAQRTGAAAAHRCRTGAPARHRASRRWPSRPPPMRWPRCRGCALAGWPAIVSARHASAGAAARSRPSPARPGQRSAAAAAWRRWSTDRPGWSCSAAFRASRRCRRGSTTPIRATSSGRSCRRCGTYDLLRPALPAAGSRCCWRTASACGTSTRAACARAASTARSNRPS